MRKSMITLNRKWIRLIGIVGCTMCLASCKQASDASGMKPSYATMKVEATDKELSTSYSATIRGRQDIDIYPQVSGTIEKLCVTEGQKVRRGQLLFIIDQVPYKAALKTAVANVEAARAALATAELTYNSNKELYAQKVVSEFSLKTAENSYLTAKAQLSQAEAQEISARNNLSYTEVKSPSDGVVGALPYRAGALVSPSLPQPLTTVSDNSDMYVYFSMTENQLLALTRQVRQHGRGAEEHAGGRAASERQFRLRQERYHRVHQWCHRPPDGYGSGTRGLPQRIAPAP